MRELIVTGKTVEEATEEACKQLGLDREEVSIEILELPTRKLFKSTPAKVRATVDSEEEVSAPAPVAAAPAAKPAPRAEQAAPAAVAVPEKKAEKNFEEVPIAIDSNPKLAAAVEYLQIVFAAMGANGLTVSAVKQGEATIIKVEGEDVGVLIGHRGETMESLSYLAGLVANRTEGDYLKLGLDVAGYRSKREKDLEALARRIGLKVAKTGRSHAMDPMNPYERRIIHSAIGEMEGVRSESKGEGAERRVIIYSTDPSARVGSSDRDSRGPRSGYGTRGGDRGGNRGGRPGDRGPRSGGRPGDRGGFGGDRGGFKGGERRSSVPGREFAETPRTEGAAPVAPKRTQLIDDAEGFALYGKIEL